MKIYELLADNKFDFLNENEKHFIAAFDDGMTNIGYTNDGIQNYVVFGKYKIEYYKPNVKTKKVVARIYIRDGDEEIAARWGGHGLGVVLRLYFTNIDKHRAYIENAPDFIKMPFIDNHSICRSCKDKCNRRKIYTIADKTYVKCTDSAFMFDEPSTKNPMEFINLLTAFYPEA
jgi:hypothetical protein